MPILPLPWQPGGRRCGRRMRPIVSSGLAIGLTACTTEEPARRGHGVGSDTSPMLQLQERGPER